MTHDNLRKDILLSAWYLLALLVAFVQPGVCTAGLAKANTRPSVNAPTVTSRSSASYPVDVSSKTEVLVADAAPAKIRGRVLASLPQPSGDADFRFDYYGCNPEQRLNWSDGQVAGTPHLHPHRDSIGSRKCCDFQCEITMCSCLNNATMTLVEHCRSSCYYSGIDQA